MDICNTLCRTQGKQVSSSILLFTIYIHLIRSNKKPASILITNFILQNRRGYFLSRPFSFIECRHLKLRREMARITQLTNLSSFGKSSIERHSALDILPWFSAIIAGHGLPPLNCNSCTLKTLQKLQSSSNFNFLKFYKHKPLARAATFHSPLFWVIF